MKIVAISIFKLVVVFKASCNLEKFYYILGIKQRGGDKRCLGYVKYVEEGPFVEIRLVIRERDLVDGGILISKE